MDRNYTSNDWDAGERSGLNSIEDCVERLVTVPLNPSDPNGGEFDLYYFVHTAAGRPTSKSILFCAGGPGQIVQTFARANTYVDFLFSNGYNVIFFHLRGTGFSQIPAGNDNDKFLRSTFAIDDMEAIRKDFLEKSFGIKNRQWEAIVGWSFGTVLAQLYAERYGELVKKLILISPLSRHMFKNSASAYDEYYKAMLTIYRITLDHIFSSSKEVLNDEFGDLAVSDKKKILDRLFNFDDGILRKTEQIFGNIQSVIDAYSRIDEGKFERCGRKFSRQFYESLRDLRIVGANAIDDSDIIEKQRLIGKTLRDELLPRKVLGTNKPVINDYDQGSQRAYYSFGIQDGLNWVFLREYFERGNSVRDSVSAIGGEAGSKGINQSLDKVKIDQRLKINPWDPADHYHKVPTLILNGELDPVTAGGQAERYFNSGLTGPRTLILFPSIGHAISLGSIATSDDDQRPILSGAIRVSLPSIRPGEILETKGMATGLELNGNLRIDLDKPEELKNTIEIHGCGMLETGEIEKSDQGDALNIIALIENLGEQDIQVQDHKWFLRTPLLWGTVDFVKPKEIPPKSTFAVFGRLIHGQRNQNQEYQISPMASRQKTEPRVKFVGFNLKEGASVELWFQNGSEDTIDPAVTQWTIQNENSKFAFRVNVPKLVKHEIASLTVEVDGLKLDATEVLAINPPDDLRDKMSACFDNEAENSHRLSFIVWNKDKTKAHRSHKAWKISCPVFSATVILDPVEIEPNQLKRVRGDVRGINWVKCLDMKPPFGWNFGLQLLSFNILGRNSVSMLFKNTVDGSIGSAYRDWKYVIPTVNADETGLNQALNCLIFSFLVSDPSQFPIPEDNEALKRIQDRYRELSFELKIWHDLGNVDELQV